MSPSSATCIMKWSLSTVVFSIKIDYLVRIITKIMNKLNNPIAIKKILMVCNGLGKKKKKTQKIILNASSLPRYSIIQFCLLFIHKRYVSLYAKGLCNKYARLFVISMLLSLILAFVTVVVIRLFFVITPFNQAFAFLYLMTGFHLILVSLSQTIIVRTCFDGVNSI